jgi:hypothetical protein
MTNQYLKEFAYGLAMQELVSNKGEWADTISNNSNS